MHQFNAGIIFNDLSFVISQCHKDTKIVLIEVDGDRKSKSTLEPFTCVTCTKKILGITNLLIQTPRQLHDYLMANGGKYM